MSFTPIGDRIFVRADNPEAVTKSGLIIPPSAQKDTGTGVVVHMGPGMLMKTGERWPMMFEIGERVIFDTRNPWPTVEVDGEKLLSMRDDAILAVIDPE
jgi:chaperonin GroES